MIKKNWARSHNFRHIVELVVDCGAIYLLHQKMENTFDHCVSKYIETMYNYMKQMLLQKMRTNLYSFYTDETSDVTLIEQFAVYTTI